jgi:hypothetical protein
MSKRSKRPKVESPSRAEREAAIKARAEAQAKAREEKLEKAADEYEAEKARAAEQAAQLPKMQPFTAMLPMMSDRELDSLATDITKNGQHEPIIYDTDGVLVDGRCRLEACRRAGIEPKAVTLPPDEDALKVWVSNNIVRQSLYPGQRAMGLAALNPETPLSELVADSGLSRGIVFEAVFVRDHQPQLISQVMTGSIQLRHAYGIAKEVVDIAKKETETFAMLERDALDLAEAIREERMNLGQAMREFKERTAKQAALRKAENALRNAEKRVKELREQNAHLSV